MFTNLTTQDLGPTSKSESEESGLRYKNSYPKFFHRPFPFKRPTIYTCTASDLYEIKANNKCTEQIVWLKVIAPRGPAPNLNRINFFGLIQINETINDYGNQLTNSPYTCTLNIRKPEGEERITFRYALITTADDDELPLTQQLTRYCSPSTTTQWVQLVDYENVWVLGISTVKWIINIKLNGPITPTITFHFPSCITLLDIVKLEENAGTRHHCTIMNCNEFSICPTTMVTPEQTSPTHGHCTSNLCVRFYEMNTIPLNPPFHFVGN